MRKLRKLALASISLVALAGPAWAQDLPAKDADQSASLAEDGIVVTARRRDEDRQDVPLVVQAVTAQDLGKLNIREFRDVQSLVPGLTLASDTNGIGNRATLRGIAYDVNASGNNGTIEFYFNEAPISAGLLFQSMFDVSQIEVLRGPQGTLRGRASPSGSITVMSRKPDLGEAGASMTGTLNTWGDTNLQAALNVPVIRDMLAVRVAGVIDENDDNRVRSINNSLKPTRRTRGIRASVRFDPIENLTLNGSYTHTLRKVSDFLQVESGNLANPALAPSPILIRPEDRQAVLRVANRFRQDFQVFNWSGQYRFLGQKLDYVGSHNIQKYFAFAPNDLGAALPSTAPANFLGAAQVSDVNGKQTNHEVRLSSDERVAGIFDYVIGALWNKLDNPTSLDVQTPVFAGSTANPLLFNRTAVLRTGGSRERSFFANLTAHLGEDTEISGGIRRIRYRSFGGLLTNGVAVAAANEDRTLHATIFSASAKHNFTRDLMVYANFGTSWRPGSASNAIQTRGQSNITGTLAAFLFPEPEKSKSYELGFKSTWFDGRLRLNADVFHQTFDNFGYAAPNIFYLTNTGGVQGVGTITTLAVGVPAKVDGVEAEIGFKILPNWDLSGTAAYSKGTISNATIPCNKYGGVVPTPAQLLAATGGEQIATCNVSNLRAGTSAPFVATLQSEYTASLGPSLDGYVRALANIYGSSLNDPTNAFDDVKSYALINLYAGLRAPDGSWEVGVFAKNLLDTDRVLTRNATTSTSGSSVAGGVPPVSAYRVISMTAPREIGITGRFAIGSR
ncbi:TonB-dependent receptor [Novosphingobium sp. JCM 18896]|uniref:TonB-dependent receptor n=1 Tax=Novosphingobium sp. JCM 18896 TaxID=2989731 RepID=UPI002223B7D7|nr:TonB-dependent receptor [Novosphingobium sp. JCM 18896]MCW1431245.1 TonB-dependent receptor [Novosphingobium sp. JCM 18896]